MATARWTWPQRGYAALLTLATLGTAGPAGFSIYQTSVALVRPYLGPASWILPVACEAAYIVLFGWGVLLAWRHVADVPARLLGSLVIAALSFAIQVYAGRHSAADVLARLAIVASFFVSGLTMKTAFMRLRGGKVRGEGASAGEWLAHPVHSARLWRWRKTWGGMALEDARARYLVLLYVIAVTQERVGKTPFRWRRSLPVTLRYELTMGLLDDSFASGAGDWKRAVRDHVADHLGPLALPAAGGATAVADGGASARPVPAEAPPSAPEPAPAAPQPKRQVSAAERNRRRQAAIGMMTANPAMALSEVAATAGLSERTIDRIRAEMPRRLRGVPAEPARQEA